MDTLIEKKKPSPWTSGKCTYAKCSDIDVETIKSDLTITIRHIVGRKEFAPTIVKLYTFLNDKIIVPRFYPKDARLCYRSDESICNAVPVDIVFKSKNQEIVYDYLENYYKRPAGCNLIMGTGEGKTHLATAIATRYAENILVIVPNEELLKNWTETFAYYDLEAGTWYGKKKDKRAITVAIINSAVDLNKDWFGSFDFCILDEPTAFVSPTRRNIYKLVGGIKRMIGLTATPEDAKELMPILQLCGGEFIYPERLPGYIVNEIKWNINVYPIKYYGPPEYTRRILSSIECTSTVEMDKQFMTDPHRNKLIIGKIRELYDIGHHIYIFVSICEYVDILGAMIDFAPYAVLMGRERTGSASEIRERIIFTTYHYCSVGVSINRMDAIILAQPRVAKSRQTLGRITRIGGDISVRRDIIDIIDANTTLKSQYSRRKKIYQLCGAVIKRPEKVVIDT